MNSLSKLLIEINDSIPVDQQLHFCQTVLSFRNTLNTSKQLLLVPRVQSEITKVSSFGKSCFGVSGELIWKFTLPKEIPKDLVAGDMMMPSFIISNSMASHGEIKSIIPFDAALLIVLCGKSKLLLMDSRRMAVMAQNSSIFKDIEAIYLNKKKKLVYLVSDNILFVYSIQHNVIVKSLGFENNAISYILSCPSGNWIIVSLHNYELLVANIEEVQVHIIRRFSIGTYFVKMLYNRDVVVALDKQRTLHLLFGITDTIGIFHKLFVAEGVQDFCIFEEMIVTITTNNSIIIYDFNGRVVMEKLFNEKVNPCITSVTQYLILPVGTELMALERQHSIPSFDTQITN